MDSRPYRSHRIPACSVCRRRKIRCEVDQAGKGCRFCRQRHLACDGPHGSNPSQLHPNHAASGKGHLLASEIDRSVETASESGQQTGLAPVSESSPMLMNPPLAEDVDILERYITSHTTQNAARSTPYIHVSHTGSESLVYHKVPRHRKGLGIAVNAGKTQREILEQVLGSAKDDVLRLYFDHVHPCFPVLDDLSFQQLWQRHPDRISAALMCDIYALSIAYWRSSELLKASAQPDHLFVWNQAVTALRDDFVAPSMTTLYAVLLDLTGRPALHVAGNIVNVGRTVTLAHSLGLHRDPSVWKVSQAEKRLRIRLWWGVLIHDLWSSLAHGTPPNIHRSNWDVTLPFVSTVVSNEASERHVQSLNSFIHLCSLTRILEEMLPIVYDLQPIEESTWKTIRKLEHSLDVWKDALPMYLKQESRECPPHVNGASNLWFCYLSVKLLLCRVSLRTTLRNQVLVEEEAKNYRLSLLRESASNVVDFVLLLEKRHFDQFWLPYISQLLVSATVVVLRCAIESSNKSQMQTDSQRLLRLLEHLRSAREVYGWDLADAFLERCTISIQQIAKLATPIDPAAEAPAMARSGDNEEPASEYPPRDEGDFAAATSFDDLFIPTDSLDYPWEALWNGIDDMW